MIVTAEQIMAWGPCSDYPEVRVRELVGDGVTPRQIADWPIPESDRYWALIRLLSPEDQRLLAAAIAERALMAARVRDPRSWAAVRVARLYAMGEVGVAELEEARAAAWAAARGAREASWVARAVCATAASASAAEAAWSSAEGAAWEAASWAAGAGAVADALRLIGTTNAA